MRWNIPFISISGCRLKGDKLNLKLYTFFWPTDSRTPIQSTMLLLPLSLRSRLQMLETQLGFTDQFI